MPMNGSTTTTAAAAPASSSRRWFALMTRSSPQHERQRPAADCDHFEARPVDLLERPAANRPAVAPRNATEPSRRASTVSDTVNVQLRS